jgi:3-methyl-2-oxobutanoate hydroxymethyltransferase
VAKAIDDAVKIFTFGIGAGNASTGQLLLAFDLLGVFDQFKPKFTKRYANLADIAVDALSRYAAEVREGRFPDDDHTYGMKPEEQQQLAALLAAAKR